MKKLLSTVAVMASLSVPAFAADVTIEMLNKRDDGAKMVYSEDVVTIDVGDTITWVPTSKGHNVEFVAGMGMLGVVMVAEGGEVPMNDVSKAKVRGKSKKKLKTLLSEL